MQNPSTNENSTAELVLKTETERARLHKVVHETALEYYCSVSSIASALALILLPIVLPRPGPEIAIWCYGALAVAVFSMWEARRQSLRLDALLRLSEVEKRQAELNHLLTTKPAAPTGQAESGSHGGE